MKNFFTHPLFYAFIFITVVATSIISYTKKNDLLKNGIEKESLLLVKYALFFGAHSSEILEGDQDQIVFYAVDKAESAITDKILKLALSKYFNNGYNSNGETVLTEALLHNKIRFAETIISNSNLVRIKNQKGFKPIFFVLDNSKRSELLVEHKADLYRIDPDQNSVFHWPLSRTQMELFAAKNKALLNAKNIEGIPPLISSMIRRDSVQFANLLDIGAHPSVSDNYGKFAMSYAAGMGKYTHWVSFLLKAEGNINQRNSDGTTPIFFVQTNKMMQYLIKNGATVDVENKDHQTPVHYYVSNSDMQQESFELIIDFLDKFVIDKLDDNGETPIMYAAQENHEKRFFALHKKFVKNNLKYKNPIKVLEYAKMGGNLKIIKAVENKVKEQMGKKAYNAYVSLPLLASKSKGRVAATGLKRIGRKKLLQKGVGRLISRAIPGLGTILLIKDTYDIINSFQ